MYSASTRNFYPDILGAHLVPRFAQQRLRFLSSVGNAQSPRRPVLVGPQPDIAAAKGKTAGFALPPHAKGGAARCSFPIYRPAHSHRATWCPVSLLEVTPMSTITSSQALYNANVAVDGKVRKSLHAATRLRPANLQAIDFLPRADAEHFPRVM